MKFVALGRTRWLYEAVRLAVTRGHEVALIGTCPAAPEYGVTERDFERLAAELGCPFFCDEALRQPEPARLLRDATAPVALSVNWLTLIGEEVLGRFSHGVLNAHAGDLPRFRGNAAPNWAILTGERRMVLTIHRMAGELDAGPILLQRAMPLTDETYIGDVYRFLDAVVPELFVEALDGLAAGTLKPRPQPADPAAALRGFPRLPCDGRIDWSRPAEELARLVRASAEPFAGAYTYLDGEKLTVWRARAEQLAYPWLGTPGQVAEVRAAGGEVAVLTGDGVLLLETVETPAAGRTRAAEAIRSVRIRLGLDAEAELLLLRRRVRRLEEQAGRSD